MELEELYNEQDNVQGGTGVAFNASVKAISEKKQADDHRKKLTHELAELRL